MEEEIPYPLSKPTPGQMGGTPNHTSTWNWTHRIYIHASQPTRSPQIGPRSHARNPPILTNATSGSVPSTDPSALTLLGPKTVTTLPPNNRARPSHPSAKQVLPPEPPSHDPDTSHLPTTLAYKGDIGHLGSQPSHALLPGQTSTLSSAESIH